MSLILPWKAWLESLQVEELEDSDLERGRDERIQHVESAAYRPFANFLPFFVELEGLMTSGKQGKALAQCHDAAKDFPIDLSVLHACNNVYGALELDEECVEIDLRAARLLQSILCDKTGTSEGDAFPIVMVREEYVVLDALGCSPKKQRSYEKEGTRFDQLTVEDESGGERDIFFRFIVQALEGFA